MVGSPAQCVAVLALLGLESDMARWWRIEAEEDCQRSQSLASAIDRWASGWKLA